MRTGVSRRPAGRAPIRRTRPVKRSSAGLSPARAGAALAMLLAAAAVYGVGASPAFEFRELVIDGAVYTDRQDVVEVVDEVRGTNLFRLSTAPLATRLRELPTVADARIGVSLPGTVSVSLTEREPILVWRVGERRYLVDEGGLLLGRLDEAPPAEAEDLPVVTDRRAASAGLSVGTRLDAVEVDAATRLASVNPAQVRSRAERLIVVLTDSHGYEVRALPGGWTAIFGFYTASLRRTDIIPGQVRTLGSLLVEAGEDRVDSVILADEFDGTYIPRATPTPAPSPS